MAQQLWTIKSTLEWTSAYLEKHGDNQARLSAQWLVCAATGLSRIELYTDYERPLSKEELNCIHVGIERRIAGEPLQYITGKASFRYIDVLVDKHVLIPRPETEVLVDIALRCIDQLFITHDIVEVIDVGTGSGCIALSLAHERDDIKISALDISDDALSIAERNACDLHLDDKIQFIQSNYLQAMIDSGHQADVVVSNPPYIPSAVLDTLEKQVVDFEPKIALDGGEDGLDAYKTLLNQLPFVLTDNGYFVCELHETKLKEAQIFAEEKGFKDVQIIKDLAGKDRIICMRNVR